MQMTAPEENAHLTPECMRKWEDRLGPEKMQTALALARSHGWRGDAPTWIWAQFFLMAEGKLPISWGPHRPQTLSESVLGFKLF